LRRERRERVVALHCSGGAAGQWSHLAEVLGGDYRLLTPEHYGCGATGHWTGEHAFALDDEAARSVALIDESDEKVHLVGHSYGGGVALHVALARPDRIVSLTLYEPSAFHLLGQFRHAAAAFAEIKAIAYAVASGVVAGDYRSAAATFVDYWNGPGAWDALRPAVQDGLIRWMPKAPLDFTALLCEPTPASVYARLTCPTLVMRGEHAPAPTRLIAALLQSLMRHAQGSVVAAAGHMGPLTHAAEVNALIVAHVTEANAVRLRMVA